MKKFLFAATLATFGILSNAFADRCIYYFPVRCGGYYLAKCVEAKWVSDDYLTQIRATSCERISMDSTTGVAKYRCLDKKEFSVTFDGMKRVARTSENQYCEHDNSLFPGFQR